MKSIRRREGRTENVISINQIHFVACLLTYLLLQSHLLLKHLSKATDSVYTSINISRYQNRTFKNKRCVRPVHRCDIQMRREFSLTIACSLSKLIIMLAAFLLPFVALLAAAPSALASPAPPSIAARDDCVTDQVGNSLYCGSCKIY